MQLSFVHRKECPFCHQIIDGAVSTCPHCKALQEDDAARRFARLVPVGTWRELACFLVGWAGFQLLGVLISVLAVAGAQSVLQGAGLTGGSLQQAIVDYANSVECSAFINYTAYSLLFLALLVTVYPYLKNLVLQFKQWKNVLYGLLMGVALLMSSILWSMIASLAWGAGESQNQEAVVSIVTDYAFFGIVITGILGPICEEITYRVGLYNLGMRIHPVVAYLFSSVVFGLIHMQDWGSVNEWMNFPSYLIAGTILGFTYHRFGFAGSTTAHVLNNIVAVVQILALSNAQ